MRVEETPQDKFAGLLLLWCLGLALLVGAGLFYGCHARTEAGMKKETPVDRVHRVFAREGGAGDHGHSRSGSKGGSAPGDSAAVIKHEMHDLLPMLEDMNSGYYPNGSIGCTGITNHGTRLNIMLGAGLGLVKGNPSNLLYREISTRLILTWSEVWKKHHPNDPRAKNSDSDPTQVFINIEAGG